MKKKILNCFIVLSLIILLVEILIHKVLVFNTISYSLEIWVNSLIPTMFPFFVISDILIHYHVTNYIPKSIKKTFCKLFHISENVVTIFFLSCLSGFPSNARNTKSYYEQGLITKEEATHALLFTHFSNPLFILSTVAIFFFHQEQYGYIILASHYLGNIMIGLFTRMNNSPSPNYTTINVESQSFSPTFIRAIRSAIDTLLLILGTLTSFLIIASLIIESFHFSPYPSTIMKGILEITMGLKNLSLLNISDLYKVVIATMFVSFGGFSVHLQVISQLVDTDIPYQPFFIARIFHAIISGGICYLLFILFF